jgi:AcrR family transcriptional regulator
VRTQILDAAFGVFAESGYRAGSLRLVADRVGMSEAGLLHHFRSKSELLQVVLERRDDDAHRFVPREPTDGLVALQGLVELARYNASTPGMVELHCTLSAEATSPDHPAHAYFVRRYQETRHILVLAFTDLERRGLLREGVSPASAARATIAMMDGLQVQWLLDRSVLDMAADLSDFLLELCPRPLGD